MSVTSYDDFLTVRAESQGGEGTKPSNPKGAQGINKSPMMSYIPQSVIAELGIAMMEGGHKYGRHNYRIVGVKASIYVDATSRHLAAFWEGENYDPDSRAELSHITKAIASLVVLRDSMIQGNWVDDRPPKSKVDWQDLHSRTKDLNEQYPDPKPSQTELGKPSTVAEPEDVWIKWPEATDDELSVLRRSQSWGENWPDPTKQVNLKVHSR